MCGIRQDDDDVPFTPSKLTKEMIDTITSGPAVVTGTLSDKKQDRTQEVEVVPTLKFILSLAIPTPHAQ